ncbi:TetR/AcrR family transcriptional regulator [Streptomyces sp. ISL-66]|uniref:TetR/AcrR family transcriptional regulator n=1 Tax=Streptomyces sp. ISL-66 TaxID=2819186 RepID=UPI0027E43F49|nr:TetR/AcrR family transcriptional regulator [Streptomyces sp. ISL-66]
MATGTPHKARGGARRAQLREQLMQDSRDAAREIIAAGGLSGLTVKAVAGKVGVTPAALYRYFDGKHGLIRALYGDITAELISTVQTAVEHQDADDLSAKLHAATHAVLVWSVAHPGEFSLLMGAGFPEATESGDEIPQAISRELGGLFAGLFVELVRRELIDGEVEQGMSEVLRRQLVVYQQAVSPGLPLGAISAMMYCWRQIYGLICMAVNHHLAFVFGDDYEALFEEMMADLLPKLGVLPSPKRRYLKVGPQRQATVQRPRGEVVLRNHY